MLDKPHSDARTCCLFNVVMPNHDKSAPFWQVTVNTAMDDSYEQPTAAPPKISPSELTEEDEQDEADEEMGLDWSRL